MSYSWVVEGFLLLPGRKGGLGCTPFIQYAGYFQTGKCQISWPKHVIWYEFDLASCSLGGKARGWGGRLFEKDVKHFQSEKFRKSKTNVYFLVFIDLSISQKSTASLAKVRLTYKKWWCYMLYVHLYDWLSFWSLPQNRKHDIIIWTRVAKALHNLQ